MHQMKIIGKFPHLIMLLLLLKLYRHREDMRGSRDERQTEGEESQEPRKLFLPEEV